MTKDVIALTPKMPDVGTLLAGLHAGGPDLGVATDADGAVIQLCGPGGRPLVSIEAPILVHTPGEAERLLGARPKDVPSAPLWWTEARASTAIPRPKAWPDHSQAGSRPYSAAEPGRRRPHTPPSSRSPRTSPRCRRPTTPCPPWRGCRASGRTGRSPAHGAKVGGHTAQSSPMRQAGGRFGWKGVTTAIDWLIKMKISLSVA